MHPTGRATKAACDSLGLIFGVAMFTLFFCWLAHLFCPLPKCPHPATSRTIYLTCVNCRLATVCAGACHAAPIAGCCQVGAIANTFAMLATVPRLDTVGCKFGAALLACSF